MRRVLFVLAVCACMFASLSPAHAGPKQPLLPDELLPPREVPPPPMPMVPPPPMPVIFIHRVDGIVTIVHVPYWFTAVQSPYLERSLVLHYR